MKCHYEILGVARDADDSEIKTAYRKLALKWHPDKNLDKPDEAKEQFQFVQQAYEVLSDPHERAWYDNHREQILRGRNSDYEDSFLDVFQYFTVSCFKGYGDDPNGFYQVYSDVFEKIAAEDSEFMDEEEFEEIPKFGNSKSNYENEVGRFYAYWQSYCTKKSYTWLCPYNISEIKDRRVLREIEKEMKKIVQKAKRERNEEVRNLVSFVRKRDKRVQAYKKYLEEKAAINRQKQEQNRLEQIRKRKQEIEEESKQLQNTNLNGDYEEQLKLLEQEYYESDEDYDDSEYDEDYVNDDYAEEYDIENSLIESTDDLQLEDDDDVLEAYANDLYCVACNRQFKNKKAFQNHEISKKHRENAEKLKKEMLAEEQEQEEEKQKSNDKLDDLINSEQIEDEEEDEKIPSQNKSKNKRSKKSKRVQNIRSSEDDEDIEENISNIVQLSDKEDDNWNDSRKSNKKSKGKKTTNQQKNSAGNNHEESVNQNEVTAPTTKTTSSSKKGNVKETTSNDIDIDINHICVTCKSLFDSKNKLFQHLKKTNHGVYIPKVKPSTTTNVGGTTTNRKGKKHK